jgi:hypothetical protein
MMDFMDNFASQMEAARKLREETNKVTQMVKDTARDFFLTDLELGLTLAGLAEQSYQSGQTSAGDRQKTEAEEAAKAVRKLLSKIDIGASQRQDVDTRLAELESKLHALEHREGRLPTPRKRFQKR